MVQWGSYPLSLDAELWCGILGDHLIGPVFLDGVLDGARSLNVLPTQLRDGELLDDVLLALATHHWLQLDGAPTHNDFMVQAFLHRAYPRGGLAAAGR